MFDPSNLSYAYELTGNDDGDGYALQFFDVPEAITGGATPEEAVECAQDCLDTALYSRIEDKEPIPSPKKYSHASGYESPSLFFSITYLARQQVEQSGPSQQELAKRLGVDQEKIQRFLSLEHHTNLPRLLALLREIGFRLEYSIVPFDAILITQRGLQP